MLRRFEHVLASRRSMQQTMAKCMKPGHLASYYTVVHQQRWLSATYAQLTSSSKFVPMVGRFAMFDGRVALLFSADMFDYLAAI